jgi:hypothetical protein
MRYMLLYYGEEPIEQPSEEEIDAEMAEWSAYDEAFKQAGVHLVGDALQPSQTATTVRVRGDERIVTDGPFAETHEVLGGFDVIDVPDLDAALDWAARSPAAKHGTVEVRPIMELGAPSQ